MWTKPACTGVQIVGLGVFAVGLFLMVVGSGTAAIYMSTLAMVAGLGLIVLSGVKIRERLRKE